MTMKSPTARISRRAFLAAAAGCASSLTLLPLYAQTDKSNVRSSFRPQDFVTVEAVVSQIVPSDATPGAKDAGVPKKIIEQVNASPKLTAVFKRGLADLDAASIKNAAAPFAALQPAQQSSMLHSIENTDFFRTIRIMTIRSFYTSQLGSRSVGYPGAGQPMGHRDFTQPPVQGR
jgi:hypothetical protein